jgi:dihydrofolate reductase
MSKVFVSVTMSLDGFVAPRWRSDEQWITQWCQLQAYVFHQKSFRERLQLGEGGETGVDDRLLEETFARTGASIMGKRMFDGGERHWPEEAPFRTPVFVLTHQVRAPWVRPGGTVFHFVNDGIHRALERAREVVGDRDIRIAGGAQMIAHALAAGVVDEIQIALSPVLLGEGIRLFDGLEPNTPALRMMESVHSPHVTHLRYAVESAA